ncbi:UDP binding domain-containing protein [Saccharopolyspora flava]|uniref:UDP-glucose/GDP-mannose dehydrogenase family, UDP binding domain n=1 Tax=Saccharopolyspora flava TaxID=95161 RepID=A0A1I6S7Y9_9PSEU|nr:UDP binding domain-containing protein [Saccharopolyspora flava]SFS73004.1 UDP-glucose/GDP-mannose dehydrogenase family, UDP binding domain [Saccharopolyspora flava]
MLLLGASYKPNIADTRETPALPVASGLLKSGADVVYHDPNVPEFAVGERELDRVERVEDGLREADLAILLQDHACYDPVRLVASRCLLLDTRGKLAGENIRHL